MIKRIKISDYHYSLKYIEKGLEIGYLNYEIVFETINITDIFVKKDYRNKYIATKMLKYLFDNSNCKRFMLEVNENNKIAIKLYEKFGFNTIHIRKKYYKEGDALIMEAKKMKDTYIFAIESSCDETSVSIVKNGIEDIATSINSQINTHKEYGGVVPELASRMHLENIIYVIDDVLQKSNMKLDDIDAFACTYTPGLVGSLLVGLETTKMLSLIYKKPFIKVNHMMGHIFANNIGEEIIYPCLSLIVSGGHTDLIYMENETSITYIGQTLDDAIGECFDKVARLVNLPYPGGPNVERLALDGKSNYKMPILLKDDSCNFSFSGIKSYISNLVNNEKQRGNNINEADLCFSFQKSVTDLLVEKTRLAIRKTKTKRLLMAGGVASNSYIRKRIKDMCDEENVIFKVPLKIYCTDNATMIGSAAYVLYKHNIFASYNTNAKSNEKFKIETIKNF